MYAERVQYKRIQVLASPIDDWAKSLGFVSSSATEMGFDSGSGEDTREWQSPRSLWMSWDRRTRTVPRWNNLHIRVIKPWMFL